jgi:hypothetical protein
MKSLKTKDENDIFILNVISNFHLTRDEILVALYLYTQLSVLPALFVTLKPKAKFKPEKHFGDGDRIQIGKPTSTYHDEIDLDSCRNLISELKNITKSMTSPRLVHILGNLHGFGYITITEISVHNTFEGYKVKNQDKIRSKLRHIRLSENMQKKDITAKWRKLKRDKRKKMVG